MRSLSTRFLFLCTTLILLVFGLMKYGLMLDYPLNGLSSLCLTSEIVLRPDASLGGVNIPGMFFGDGLITVRRFLMGLRLGLS